MKNEPRMDTNGHELKTRILSVFTCVYLCFIAFFMPSFAYTQETITVAVASSLYAEMQKKAASFEQEHDVLIRLVSGSTGRLYNQIMQGAPFDVFIAADDERPAMLANQGKAIARFEAGKAYLGVRVGTTLLGSLDQLNNASIRRIAIANPDVAPFGKVSKELLQKQGLWQALKHKFVYAQNAMQAAMLVDQNIVDAGFVPLPAREDALAVIHYHAVLLSDATMARPWLDHIMISHRQLATRNH